MQLTDDIPITIACFLSGVIGWYITKAIRSSQVDLLSSKTHKKTFHDTTETDSSPTTEVSPPAPAGKGKVKPSARMPKTSAICPNQREDAVKKQLKQARAQQQLTPVRVLIELPGVLLRLSALALSALASATANCVRVARDTCKKPDAASGGRTSNFSQTLMELPKVLLRWLGSGLSYLASTAVKCVRIARDTCKRSEAQSDRCAGKPSQIVIEFPKFLLRLLGSALSFLASAAVICFRVARSLVWALAFLASAVVSCVRAARDARRKTEATPDCCRSEPSKSREDGDAASDEPCTKATQRQSGQKQGVSKQKAATPKTKEAVPCSNSQTKCSSGAQPSPLHTDGTIAAREESDAASSSAEGEKNQPSPQPYGDQQPNICTATPMDSDEAQFAPQMTLESQFDATIATSMDAGETQVAPEFDKPAQLDGSTIITLKDEGEPAPQSDAEAQLESTTGASIDSDVTRPASEPDTETDLDSAIAMSMDSDKSEPAPSIVTTVDSLKSEPAPSIVTSTVSDKTEPAPKPDTEEQLDSTIDAATIDSNAELSQDSDPDSQAINDDADNDRCAPLTLPFVSDRKKDDEEFAQQPTTVTFNCSQLFKAGDKLFVPTVGPDGELWYTDGEQIYVPTFVTIPDRTKGDFDGQRVLADMGMPEGTELASVFTGYDVPGSAPFAGSDQQEDETSGEKMHESTDVA